MSSAKKRKMEKGSDTSAGTHDAAEPSSSLTDAGVSASPALSDDGDTMMESNESSSASLQPSADELSALLAQLPQALTLLNSPHLQAVIQTQQFHPLRKTILRTAATLQKGFLAGETKDDVQKRMYRKREKVEKAARELKQRAEDQKYINSVALRTSRIQALNAMIEPEGWGDKQGDKLLMPGSVDTNQLLLTVAGSSSTADSLVTGSSIVVEPSSMIPTAAVLAAAAGPQAFTYPTIAPDSNLAELVEAETTNDQKKVKVKTKPIGGSSTALVNSAAAAEAPKASVIIPSLTTSTPTPSASPPPSSSSSALISTSTHTGSQLPSSQSQRQVKKTKFGQEGVHVNEEVLEESKKREQEEKEKMKSQVKKVEVEDDVVHMDTSSGSATAPSSSSTLSSASPPSASEIASVLSASQASDPVSTANPTSMPEFGPVLNNPRSCYCCKNRFYQLHFFYSEFCSTCARLNYVKRNQLADLRGKVILLTGSRVKIGFRCGLRLLRCGATLIATSRFPHDTAKRYAEEKDFDVWKSRLHIFGLDLRDLKSVVKLSDILSTRYERLDAIINNAAQTVRRPPMYYRHLLPIECLEPKALPKDWRDVVKGDAHELVAKRLKEEKGKEQGKLEGEEKNGDVTIEDVPASSSAAASSSSAAAASSSSSTEEPSIIDVFQQNTDLNSALLTASSTSTLNRSAILSQLEVLSSDSHADATLFPANRFDVTGQQLDLRTVNSWNLTLDQIDPSELVEVFAINALSPFLLNSRLKGLMLKGGAHPQFGPSVQTCDKYIINVSAMEGKFYRHKSPYHPHTNAAKAALNMLTRTSSQDYAKDRIYMNSVDTGWINDENPYETSKRIAESSNFQTPIDEEDAMARILDPLLTGVNTGINCFGKFFKDYHETEW